MSFVKLGKTFKELNDGDFIYYINPFVAVRKANTPLDVLLLPTFNGNEQLVQGVKIKHVKGIPNEPNYATWVEIEYYRPETVMHSPDLNNIPTVKLRFNGIRNFAFTLVKLQDQTGEFPVPYCTTREYLVEYVKRDWGKMSSAFKQLIGK